MRAVLLAACLLLAGCAASTDKPAMVAHGHIENVLVRWGDTPGEAGLLPTAHAEAAAAVTYAARALWAGDDIERRRSLLEAAAHIDPHDTTGATSGVSMSGTYGVVPALQSTITQLTLAAGSPDATPRLRELAAETIRLAHAALDRAQSAQALALTMAQGSEPPPMRAHADLIEGLVLLADGRREDGSGLKQAEVLARTMLSEAAP